MSTKSSSNQNIDKKNNSNRNNSGFTKDHSTSFEHSAVKNPVPGKGKGGKK